jgi:hypothetical protein
MFKFTPSQEVFDMCLRALLHTSGALRATGMVLDEDQKDDFQELHSRLTSQSENDGPLKIQLFLPSILNLSIALRTFLKTEISEKHPLANEGWMLEGAMSDFAGTMLAMPPKVINAKTLEIPPPTEEERWLAKRDAIMREIFVPKSRLNIWGQEVPTEPEPPKCGNCGGRGKLLRGQYATEATECPQCDGSGNKSETETRQVAVYYQGKRMKAAEAAKVLESSHVKHLMGDYIVKEAKDGILNLQVPKPAEFIMLKFKVGGDAVQTDPNEDLLDGADPASFNERMKVEGNMAEHVKARQKAAQVAGLQDAYGGGKNVTTKPQEYPKHLDGAVQDISGSGASSDVPLFYTVYS